jgi:hypothetical protein
MFSQVAELAGVEEVKQVSWDLDAIDSNADVSLDGSATVDGTLDYSAFSRQFQVRRRGELSSDRGMKTSPSGTCDAFAPARNLKS